MKLTTTKDGNGNWDVKVDGRATTLVVGKCEAPKWGMKQEWAIGVRYPDGTGFPEWLADGIPGKAQAVSAIEKIALAISEATQ